MTLGDFLDKVRELPRDTPLCVAEVDEAAGMNVAAVDVIRDARVNNAEADGEEAVAFGDGDETVVILWW